MEKRHCEVLSWLPLTLIEGMLGCWGKPITHILSFNLPGHLQSKHFPTPISHVRKLRKVSPLPCSTAKRHLPPYQCLQGLYSRWIVYTWRCFSQFQLCLWWANASVVALGYKGKHRQLGHPFTSSQPRVFAPSQILPAFSFSLMGLSHLGRIKVDILGSAMFIPRDSGLVIETLFYIQGR